MPLARMRPSASPKGTVSTSCPAVPREPMIATASSTDIIGPPKAKQSSDNCAIWFSGFWYAFRQHVFDFEGRRMHHGGDRLDVIEMGHRKLCFKLGVGCDANNAGIVWK